MLPNPSQKTKNLKSTELEKPTDKIQSHCAIQILDWRIQFSTKQQDKKINRYTERPYSGALWLPTIYCDSSGYIAAAIILLVHGNDLGPSCPRGDIRYPGANMGSRIK